MLTWTPVHSGPSSILTVIFSGTTRAVMLLCVRNFMYCTLSLVTRILKRSSLPILCSPVTPWYEITCYTYTVLCNNIHSYTSTWNLDTPEHSFSFSHHNTSSSPVCYPHHGQLMTNSFQLQHGLLSHSGIYLSHLHSPVWSPGTYTQVPYKLSYQSRALFTPTYSVPVHLKKKSMLDARHYMPRARLASQWPPSQTTSLCISLIVRLYCKINVCLHCPMYLR
jgi:hypothetical protein